MNELDQPTRYRTDQAKNLVGFLVGSVRYAVEIQKVREIVNPLDFVSLPHAPSEVIGVADHRGEVLPVVDLRVRFGVAPSGPTRRTKWVIVKAGSFQQPVALVVDAVTEVFGAGKNERREIPEIGGGEAQRGISNVYAHRAGLVFVVDPTVVAASAVQLDIQAELAQLGEGQSG